MVENVWQSLIELFIIKPFNQLKKNVFEIQKLIRTIYVNIKLPGRLLNSEIDTDKYLNTIESVRVMFLVIFLILSFKVSLNLKDSSSFDMIFSEFFILLIYFISVVVIIGLGYLWNFTGNFKIERTSYTTNSLVYLFNSIYSILFFYNLIFSIKELSESSISGISFLVFFLIIPFITIYHFYRENNNLNYSKWNIIYMGVLYIFVMYCVVAINLIVLQYNFYNH